MSFEFSEDQKKVIEARNQNVIVSAAAGSGKTAVLVERIIRMILEEKDGKRVDIDRLLVVTFTEAAALEMRERIGKAIDDALALNPSDEHLLRQSALLYKAQISTIHSFCLNVIRNNFNVIGLDPAFRVADETELRLLSQDVLNEIFEEKYENSDEDFLGAVEYFSKGVWDDDFREFVLKIYKFSQGYPWPEEWLSNCLESYRIDSVKELEDSSWMKYLMQFASYELEEALKKSLEALELVHKPHGPVKYEEAIEEDVTNIRMLLEFTDYEGLREGLANLSFKKLSSAKDPLDADMILKKKVSNLRDQYKKMLSKDSSSGLGYFFELPLEDEVIKIQRIYPFMRLLINLVSEFAEKYEEKRLEKGIISFNDMEHFALRILYTIDENGNRVPSDTAIELRASFDEILMDEYQDCNRVQEELMCAISSETSNRYNRFMVGDVKQSIYKFRLANPELFIEKYKCYRTDDQIGQADNHYRRIDLHQNYRSRESVINTVNDLFSQIMHEDLGGVEYDENAGLVYGADYPQTDETDSIKNTSSQIMLLVKDDGSNLSKGVQEAEMIARKIKELLSGYQVTDKETKALRPLEYKDIVILVRSMGGTADGIKKVFAREGIPVSINMNSGFYETREVQNVIQFLKVIDNPRQDIPLYGALTSYFGGMTDEEIALIQGQKSEVNEKDDAGNSNYADGGVTLLYDKLLQNRDKNEKVAAFLDFLDLQRKKSAYTPIHRLISDLVYDTGYVNYVSAQAGGAQRKANISMLISKAASFESTSYKGIFHFIRYILEIKKIAMDEGEADVTDENANVVRIMTIHKSKGLEFPVCFVAETHKQFNMDDAKGILVTDMDYGPGASFVDLKLRIKNDPLMRKVINLKIKQDVLGEELRVLYVALTRAREKLIITGVIDDGITWIEKRREYEATKTEGVGMSYSDRARAKCYLDYLVPLIDEDSIFIANKQSGENAVSMGLKRIELRGAFIDSISRITADSEEYRSLRGRFDASYPYSNLQGMIQKTSVSELKKAYIDENYTEILFPETDVKKEYIPSFIRTTEDAITATDRGSAYHKVMELIDFSDKDVKSQINKFVEKQLISKAWADSVNVTKIQKVLESKIGERMAKAQKNGALYKEQPFVLGIEANRVKPDYPKEELLLLQGIIDVFFVEEDGIILLDYKTDAIKTGKELIDRYKVQLDYYQEALERIVGKKVKERILYSFALSECVME